MYVEELTVQDHFHRVILFFSPSINTTTYIVNNIQPLFGWPQHVSRALKYVLMCDKSIITRHHNMWHSQAQNSITSLHLWSLKCKSTTLCVCGCVYYQFVTSCSAFLVWGVHGLNSEPIAGFKSFEHIVASWLCVICTVPSVVAAAAVRLVWSS